MGARLNCVGGGSEAPLVAGKLILGCETCLPRRPEPAAAPAKDQARRAARPGQSGDGAAKTPQAAAGKPPARPAVPPRAKKPKRPAVEPEKIAEQLWTSVACGDAGKVRRLLAPGSPAEFLYEVLGPPGLTQAIGFAPDVAPGRFSAVRYRMPGASPVLVSGQLEGQDGTTRAYFLAGLDGLVTEVLPSPVFADGRLSHAYWWGEAGDVRWRPSRVPRDADVDPVGRILLGTGPAWHGLCVAARSVLAWERIAGSHERILSARKPREVAAAVGRLISYRAGGRGTFASAAAVYQVTESAIRSADRVIRPALDLSAGRPW